jgi:hypothetical protein
MPRSVYAPSSAMPRSNLRTPRPPRACRTHRANRRHAARRPSHRRVRGDVLADFGDRVAHFRRHDHHADRQAVGAREFPVALVVARHRHHRAGAVVHQHEVGDVDRQRLAGDRVQRAQAGVHAALGLGFQLGFGDAAVAEFSMKAASAGSRFAALRQRMFGGDADEGDAHQRVGARGEHRQRRRRCRRRERELQAFAAPDPVALHRASPRRASRQRVQAVEQLPARRR